jgi:hypothetical protein
MGAPDTTTEAADEPEPPSLRRLLWLSCGVCVLFSGPVFGFGALQTVMERDGEYGALCEGEGGEDGAARADGRSCAAQETAMALIYTMGGTLPFWSGPAGFALDLLGPTASVGVAGALVTTGLLLFGLSSTDPGGVDLLPVGYLLMAVGGCLGTMCVFPVGFLFPPARRGQVFGLLNCLFDASSAVFLPLQLLHGWAPAVFSRLHWFVVSAGIAAALYTGLAATWRGGHGAAFAQMKLDNAASFGGAADDTATGGGEGEGEGESGAEKKKQKQQPPPIHERSVSAQVCSAEFVCFTLFCGIHITKSTSFLGINKMILADLGDSNQTYLAIFTALLPASVICVPLITWCLDRFGLGGGLHAVNALGAGYAAASLVPSLPFQLVTFAIYTNCKSSLSHSDDDDDDCADRQIGALAAWLILYCPPFLRHSSQLGFVFLLASSSSSHLLLLLLCLT